MLMAVYMRDDSSWTVFQRGQALINALRDGPLVRSALLGALGSAYPAGDAGRRMLDRDLPRLAELGILIERSATRPPLYTLRATPQVFSADELRTLALIRDTFGNRHPQAAQVHALLQRLTADLGPTQQRDYARRQATTAPVQPAIDYTPYAPLITRLESCIARQQTVSLTYAPAYKPTFTTHTRVEPYDIEFYERHFYLVAYTHASQQVQDFRIDRIQADSLQPVSGGRWSHRRRSSLRFRYRLAAALAQGEISQRFEEQEIVEWLPNGDVIIEARGRSAFFIVQTLLRYRANAELLWPMHLRERMAREAAALAELYE